CHRPLIYVNLYRLNLLITTLYPPSPPHRSIISQHPFKLSLAILDTPPPHPSTTPHSELHPFHLNHLLHLLPPSASSAHKPAPTLTSCARCAAVGLNQPCARAGSGVLRLAGAAGEDAPAGVVRK